MKLKLSLVMATLVVSLATIAAAATPSATAAAPSSSAATVPVTGTTADSTFAGSYTINRFRVINGALNAVGTVSGTLTNTATGATTPVPATAVTVPVAAAAGTTCHILNLTLGPLDLNLLGLVVHLDTVHLTIDAQQAPGNLLGNLLCAVAGLLDNNSTGALNGIVVLLNQILAQL
jgi:hypothetical protein